MLELGDTPRAELAPIVALLGPLQREIDAAERRVAVLASADPAVRRLMSVGLLCVLSGGPVC